MYRDLRSYAAALSERGLARASVARKLAAVRSFHDHLTRTGAAPQNPAELLPMPKKESRLPRVLAPDDIARLLDRIPASGPLEVRDRAMLEVTYACGLRAEEIINLDDDSVDFDSEALRVTGKGSKTRIVPMGEPAQRALDRYLRQARPALANDRAEPALFLSRRGRRLSPSDVRRTARPLGARGGRRRACVASHAPPLLRDASARGGRRFALNPGAFGTLERLDDPGLHARGAWTPAPRVRTSHPRA